jgi:DNA polymerase III subunit delta
MTALKGDAIDRFIKRPDKAIIIIYGADHGRVVETSKKIRVTLGASGDAFNEITLDASTLTADPARLKDEAQTMSMFGDKRLIRVLADTANLTASVSLLMDLAHNDSITIIEAGDVKPTAPLVALIEKSPHAVSIRCFSETIVDLSRRIDQEVANAGLVIKRDAKELLLTQLGADMALSSREIEKLLLYMHGQSEITVADVRASLADASSLTIDDIMDASFNGQPDAALSELTKALESDESPVFIHMMLVRHAQMLLSGRVKMEKGMAASGAVETMRPPVFFTRKAMIERQLVKHSVASLTDELDKLHHLSSEIRLNARLAHVLLERAILRIALSSKRR